MTDVPHLNIVPLHPADPARDPDVVLEAAKGEYSHVLILGWSKDTGNLDARASTNLKDGGDVLWLIECFKKRLMDGAYGPDSDA